MIAPTKNYEVAFSVDGPNCVGPVVTVTLAETSPGDALDGALRTFIRNHIREVFDVLDNPEDHEPGINDVRLHLRGARVHERYFPSSGGIQLLNRLVLDIDQKTLQNRVDHVF